MRQVPFTTRRVAIVLGSLFVAGVGAAPAALAQDDIGDEPPPQAAGEMGDGRKMPSSIELKVGQVKQWHHVNFAGITDDKALKIKVMGGILTLTGKRVGNAFLFVMPLAEKGPRRGRDSAEGVGKGAKKQIFVRVSQ